MKELDVILLKDGREATILEIYADGAEYLVEIADKRGKTLDTPIVKKSEIIKILYVA